MRAQTDWPNHLVETVVMLMISMNVTGVSVRGMINTRESVMIGIMIDAENVIDTAEIAQSKL
jgi:hypothetical protein